ncbi:MAG: peptidylprolyl isomerase, partial [Candidatus Poribacteria bacterium]
DEIKKQFKTEKEFEDAMKAEGYTMESLKKEKKRSLLLQELIKQKFASDLVIKDDEVKKFYRENRDKFPAKNDTVKLKHLLIRYNLTKEDKEKARSNAEEVLRQCRNGADFSEMALRYSDDPVSRANKGNIGYFIPGTGDYPEYEEIVTKLKPGEISDLIEIADGFDIIKVTDIKRDGRIGLQRIHIAIKPDPLVEKATLEKADSILKELKKGADFVQMVRKYSDDQLTKDKDGDWMEVNINNLSDEMKNAFNSLEVGEVSQPIKSFQGVHIFKIVDRKELSEDEMEQIRRYLADKRLQEKLEEYSKKLKETAYIAYPKSSGQMN